MGKYQKFLKVSSVIVKVIAWIFLFLGVIGGGSIISGLVPGNPRWMGAIVIAIYGFSFFFFYLIAKIAEILAQIIDKLNQEAG